MSWDHLRSAELKLMQPPQHGFQSYAATTSFSCVTRVSGCMAKEIIWREVFRNYLNVFNILSVGVIWVHFSGFQRTRVDTCRLCDATASFRCLSRQILLDLTKRKQSRSQQKEMWSWKTFWEHNLYSFNNFLCVCKKCWEETQVIRICSSWDCIWWRGETVWTMIVFRIQFLTWATQHTVLTSQNHQSHRIKLIAKYTKLLPPFNKG